MGGPFWFDGLTWERPYRVDQLRIAALFGVTVGTWVAQATDATGHTFMTLPPDEVMVAYGMDRESA